MDTVTGQPAPVMNEADFRTLCALRQRLHQNPEPSGDEAQTANIIAQTLTASGATDVHTLLGGHGVAGVYVGEVEGPTVVLRAAMDAMALCEKSSHSYQSTQHGLCHAVGNDGQMAVLLGVAKKLNENGLKTGKVVLLFQGEGQSGVGLSRMMDDPRFAALRPDYCFSMRSMAQRPMGQVYLAAGKMNCCSSGLRLTVTSKSNPMKRYGHEPMPFNALIALTEMICEIAEPDDELNYSQITVTHLRVGETTFDVSPHTAEVLFKLRACDDKVLARIKRRACDLIDEFGARPQIDVKVKFEHEFKSSANSRAAVALVTSILEDSKVPYSADSLPQELSDDFELLTRDALAASLYIGVGPDSPPLGSAFFDYPDDLMIPSIQLYQTLIERLLCAET